GYLYTGVADLAAETGDEGLAEAAKTLWNNVVNRQMYVTGGVGSQVWGEAFTFDYHLPNDSAYNETCAAISMVFFAKRMLRLDPDSRYADVMERLIYNGTISGMALDGEHFFYTNPLAMWESATKRAGVVSHIQSKRPGWFGCACCPPNLARMITSLGSYLYSTSADTVYAHLYVGSEADLDVGGQRVKIAQSGNYPWDGHITFTVSAGDYALALRIPGWARSFRVQVNGEDVHPAVTKGYAVLRRAWRDGDTVELDLPMPVEFVEANPLLRADDGRVALMRGPVVYCLESADNGDCLDALSVVSPGDFYPEEASTVFPGEVDLVGRAVCRKPWTTDTLYRRYDGADAEDVQVRAIPYAFWGNREDTREMTVWIHKT
nr:glycoside hydrolase family 127 protein [Clostridiales bacterium]